MTDAISRSAVIRALQKAKELASEPPTRFDIYIHKTFDLCIRLIAAFDAVDAAPVVHAKWLIVAETWDDGIEADEDWYVKCSRCGRNNYDVDVFKLMDGNIEDVKRDFPYCHCGARMDGEAHD